VSEPLEIIDNVEAKRFQTTVDGHTAVVTYHREGDIITYEHTVVPEQLKGGGVGSALAKYVLDYARAEGLQVVPNCPFIAAYIRRHMEYDDLIYDPY